MTDSQATPPVPERRRHDYYFISAGADETGEPWFRWLPAMRLYGVAVLVTATAIAFPRDDAFGWRGLLAAGLLAALAIAFAVMWIRRPIWHYDVRVLLAHGVFQLAAYSCLVVLEPGFAILALLVYPQIVFSLAPRWAVAGGLYVGAVTGLAAFLRAGDLQTALPAIVSNLLGAAIVVALAMWVRETIAQSLERQVLVDQLRATRAELAAAERKAGAAEERARLAREIHDTLAQGFASVVAHLEAADACLDANRERARSDMSAAEEVARASLAEARTLVWALRPETIATAGLPAAIERVAAAGGGQTGPVVEVTISGTVRTLHPEVEVTLLRSAQEALANARRHARAAHIAVTLTYFGDEVSLDVTDDGTGFEPSAAGRSSGVGLLGMRERAERLGGTLTIESAPGEGTAIAVTLPAIEPPAALPYGVQSEPSEPSEPSAELPARPAEAVR